MVTVAAVVPPLRAQGQPASTSSPAPTSQPAMQTLDQLSAVLNGRDSRQEERDEAARRLVARHSPDAHRILGEAVNNFNAQNGAQLASVKAISEDPIADPGLIAPLMSALNNANSPQLQLLALRALTNYRDIPMVMEALWARVVNRPANERPDTQLRIAIIRSLGSFIQRQNAEGLIALLDPNKPEVPASREAAMDSLAELTGITDFGQDSHRWTQWWEQNRNRPPEELRNEMLVRRSARLEMVRQLQDDTVQALAGALRQNYQLTSPAQRPQRLMALLRNPNADVRTVGASLAAEDFLNQIAIPPEIRAQLRHMIGDSSPKVRKAVALALTPINDPDAVDPLIAQLAVEPDTGVRLELVRAISPIKSARAVAELIKLLNDGNLAIVMETAAALERVGPTLREENPTLAGQTGVALRDKFRATPAGNPATSGLREKLVQAMAPLGQATLLQDPLSQILREQNNESSEMRRLAVKAIGEIGQPGSRPAILPSIEDNEARVRQEAIMALGKLNPTAEDVQILKKRLEPSAETDKSCRDAAWEVLQTVFANLTTEQLNALRDDEPFKGDPARRIVILKAVETKLQKDSARFEDLSEIRWNVGALLLNNPDGTKDPKAAEEAVKYIEQALTYKLTQPNAPQVTIVGMTRDLIRAQLRSGQYPKAALLAADSIRRDSQYQQVMGSAIRAEAEELQQGGKVDDLIRLIEAAKTMNPPLDEQYKSKLGDIEGWARQQLLQRSVMPENPLPHTPSQDAANGVSPLNRLVISVP